MPDPKRGDSGWEQFRSCTRKHRYEEPPTNHAGWTRPYRCRFCDGWHLTSKPRTGKDKDKVRKEQDIIDRLLDFERCGLTAIDRVNMRENAAIVIHNLRQENERMRQALRGVLNASNDPYDEARRGLGDRLPHS